MGPLLHAPALERRAHMVLDRSGLLLEVSATHPVIGNTAARRRPGSTGPAVKAVATVDDAATAASTALRVIVQLTHTTA